MSLYPKNTDETCDHCGSRATAYWQGERTINICACCATSQLPCLIADAVPVRVESDAFRFIEIVTAKFWRSLALRFIRRNESTSLRGGCDE